MQYQIPASAFATRRQTITPEGIQSELLPQLTAEPARAPLPRPAQRHRTETKAHDGQIVIGALHWRIFVWKERDLLRSLVILAEEIDGLAPRSFLSAIEFAEIEDVALKHLGAMESAIFDDTPVEVFFAILEPFRATKKHDG